MAKGRRQPKTSKSLDRRRNHRFKRWHTIATWRLKKPKRNPANPRGREEPSLQSLARVDIWRPKKRAMTKNTADEEAEPPKKKSTAKKAASRP